MTQDSDTAISTTQATARWLARRSHDSGAVSPYANARAGNTTKAAAIFTFKPIPTTPMATHSHARLPRSVALSSAHAASSRVRTRQLSVLLERSTATLSGVSARNRAASRPAAGPKRRWTR